MGFCPVEILFLDIDQLYDHLLSFQDNSTVVLVADQGLLELLNQQDLPEKLSAHYHLIWIDRVQPNPVQTDILDALQAIGLHTPDHIIAVGGGSAIDLAKAISASWALFRDKAPSVGNITQMIREKSYQSNPAFIPITAVPTTAGTGSELTKWATIWDMAKKA